MINSENNLQINRYWLVAALMWIFVSNRYKKQGIFRRLGQKSCMLQTLELVAGQLLCLFFCRCFITYKNTNNQQTSNVALKCTNENHVNPQGTGRVNQPKHTRCNVTLYSQKRTNILWFIMSKAHTLKAGCECNIDIEWRQDKIMNTNAVAILCVVKKVWAKEKAVSGDV